MKLTPGDINFWIFPEGYNTPKYGVKNRGNEDVLVTDRSTKFKYIFS